MGWAKRTDTRLYSGRGSSSRITPAPGVRIDWNDRQVVKEVQEVMDRAGHVVARRLYGAVKRSSAFKDKTGTLRSRIRMHKSRFKDGGYVVMSAAPHTHLVEYGHDLVKGGSLPGGTGIKKRVLAARHTQDPSRRGKGKKVGRVPAHSFILSALTRHKQWGERYIKRRISREVGQ
jgi:hypothetical protein